MKDREPTGAEVLEHSLRVSGLDDDAINLLTGEHTALYNVKLSGEFDSLKPLKTYEEYLHARDAVIPKRAEETIRRSDPAQVKRVNELIAQYNSILPRIITERNTQIGKDILDQITAVFRGKK